MKKLFLVLMLTLSLASYSQTIKKDSNGNFYQIDKSVVKKTTVTKTGKIFTDKSGFVYPVYVTKTGKLFVLKVSKKTGNSYRYYLN